MDNYVYGNTSRSKQGLGLRVVTEDDLGWLAWMHNDSSTWSNLTDPSPVTAADQAAWFANMTGRKRLYFIADEPSAVNRSRACGLVRMDEIDHINKSIRVGLDVHLERRNQGVGTRVYKELILPYCFDALNMHRVWLQVLASNPAQRLYERLGFKGEGRLREAVRRNGAWIDYLVMSILEDEWRKCTWLAMLRRKRPPDRPFARHLNARESVRGWTRSTT